MVGGFHNLCSQFLHQSRVNRFGSRWLRLALLLFPHPVNAAATEIRALRLYPRKLIQAMDTQR